MSNEIKGQVLLLHGALGSKSQMDKVVAAMSNNYEVHALNFSGHGGRPVEDYSIELFSNDVLRYLDEAQLHKPHVFGYSMGGYVALCLARKFPDMLGKIMTLGTKFAWSPSTAEQEVKFLDTEKIMAKVPDFARRLETLHAPADWKEVVANTRNLLLGLGNHPLLNEEDLRLIENEVLIGWGSNDNMVTEQESRDAANSLAKGRFILIEGFKHPIEMIDPQKLGSILSDFL